MVWRCPALLIHPSPEPRTICMFSRAPASSGIPRTSYTHTLIGRQAGQETHGGHVKGFAHTPSWFTLVLGEDRSKTNWESLEVPSCTGRHSSLGSVTVNPTSEGASRSSVWGAEPGKSQNWVCVMKTLQFAKVLQWAKKPRRVNLSSADLFFFFLPFVRGT